MNDENDFLIVCLNHKHCIIIFVIHVLMLNRLSKITCLNARFFSAVAGKRIWSEEAIRIFYFSLIHVKDHYQLFSDRLLQKVF